jgi:ubiquinone/menaquinone biosynthesis C-methylase UbiE
VSFIYHLLTIASIRKLIWRWWYPFVTRRLQGEEVLFLNYGFEEDPPMGIALQPEEEVNRACIQLYHHVATQKCLQGKTVLEVSSGHGGGAVYVAGALQPRRYTALDLNPAAVQFCRQRHQVNNLEFAQGDSGNLPFSASTFDAVINVEASHCYPVFARFLAEVTRVLRLGGHFLYADFRFREDFSAWEDAFASAPLRMLHRRSINAEVLRGIGRNSTRSLELIARRLPKFMHALGRDFAGLEGSRVNNSLKNGNLSYRSYCFEKPVNQVVTDGARLARTDRS